MSTFNTTTYDASGVSYNTERPVYIDGTVATIPVSGTKYYNGLFGNVMCSFINDGGDTILGGNAIVSGVLNVGDGLNVLNTSGNTRISTTSLAYLSGITSNVQAQLTALANSAVSLLPLANTWTSANIFKSKVTAASALINAEFQCDGTATMWAVNVNDRLTANGISTFAGTTSFNSSLPTSTQTPTTATQLTTKSYVDSAISSATTTSGASLLSLANTWTKTNIFADTLNVTGMLYKVDSTANGTSTHNGPVVFNHNSNSFTSYPPTCASLPTTLTQLTNKAYVDTAISSASATSGSSLLSLANTWTGASNRFGTLYAQYLNVPAIDATTSLGAASLNVSGAASLNGTTIFTASLPTSTITPTSATQLIPKSYADGLIVALKSAANTWSSLNTFNSISVAGATTLSTLVATGTTTLSTLVATGTTTLATLNVSSDSTLNRAYALKNMYANNNHDTNIRWVAPTYVRMTPGPGAYINNGGGGSYPIYGDIRKLSYISASDSDDSYLVLAGFKLVMYIDEDFLGQTLTMDNTTSSVARYYSVDGINGASSCKLYYNDHTSGIVAMEMIYNGGTVNYV